MVNTPALKLPVTPEGKVPAVIYGHGSEPQSIAVDARELRSALGAERINILGGSYGTRAVLEYQRQFPQHVRRAVIDGVATFVFTVLDWRPTGHCSMPA